MVPSLLALGVVVIAQPQVTGFAVFGTFAHLVMVEYDPAKATRAAKAALTLVGVLLVSTGTLVSRSLLAAIAGAATAGFLSESPAFV